jgi:polyisoprenoid-binding protein YceI
MHASLKVKTLLLSLALGAALSGCSDPNKDKTKATTTEAISTAAAAVAPANATAYAFDGKDSKVSFVGAKVTGKHDGSFGTFTGSIKIPGTDIEKGSVSASIDTASVTSDDEKLTGHLKSPDFFDVEKFPKATFESTGVKKAGDAYTITGNLTLHGVTKSITFPAKIAVAGDDVTVDADFTINRKDFGIVYAGKADNLIRDDVALKLALKAKKS